MSAWYVRDDEHGTVIALSNASNEPVYRVLAFLVFIQGAGPQTGIDVMSIGVPYWAAFGVLPPGRYYAGLEAGWRGMSARVSVEVAFTDRNGSHWVRHADGALLELTEAPERHYAISLPVNWATPSDAPPND